MKKTFLKGAAILGIAGIIIKAMGAAFRIPLANIIGDTGMGYYQTAYPVYVLLLTVSTAGIPTAIAKLVSERSAEGDTKEAFRIFKLSFVLLVCIGLASFLILFFGAPYIVRLSAPQAVYAMQAIAPALLVIPMMTAFRGYYQGLQDMMPTALSQVTEQLVRVVCGLGLAVLLLSYGVEFAAAGASFGAAAGGIAGFITVLIIFTLKRTERLESLKNAPEPGSSGSAGAIIGKLVWIAIPITIGAAVMPLMSAADMVLVNWRLTDAGFTPDQTTSLYGQLSGFAVPLINFPQVLTQSIAISIVPAIAAAHQLGKKDEVVRNTELGLRTAMIAGLPCAAGMLALSEPIMLMLYPNQRESAVSAAGALAVLAVGVIFLSSLQTLTGVLQGIGKQAVPVINLLIGLLVKIAVTYVLAGIPELNIKGAAAGTVCAYLAATILNVRAVKRWTGVRFDMTMTFIKPGLASAVMGAFVWVVYHIFRLLSGNLVSTLLSVAAGVIVYIALIFAMRALSEDEIAMLPKGEKILRLLGRMKNDK